MEHPRPPRQGLGQAIRELREARAPRLSQEELGRRAGYRTGAGVSMSRIENGVTRPGPRRLEGIASALGVTVRELETWGTQRLRAPDAPFGAPEPPRPASDRPAGAPGDAADGRVDTPVTARVGEPTKDRLRRIQADFERRNTEATSRALAFNAAHDRARDEFFLAFVAAADTIRDLPAPRPPSPAGGTSEAALRRRVAAYGIAATLGSGAGAAAADGEPDRESAYDAVIATAVLTPAPAAAHPDHGAGATARAARALLGGGTARAGGTGLTVGALLAGFLASAASPLFAASTLIWLARRSRQQNEQLRLELDRAEANLVSTQRGFEAVMDLLGRATERLDYVAVHGGHAHGRWQAQLPTDPRAWTDLSEDQQGRYAAFVEVAACQVCVDTIDMTELLAATGPQQTALIQVADDILTLARQDVERLV